MKDYYRILNISYKSDIQQIKQAYRNLAIKYHPDKSKDPSTAKIFIEITEAYEVLKDPLKRKQYDILFTVNGGSYQTEQEKTWQTQGETKAKEYSSMPYKEFKFTVLDEVKLFVKYLPSFLYALFCFLCGLFSIYVIIIKGSVSGLITLMCCIFFGCFVYSETIKDYKTDRNKS